MLLSVSLWDGMESNSKSFASLPPSFSAGCCISGSFTGGCISGSFGICSGSGGGICSGWAFSFPSATGSISTGNGKILVWVSGLSCSNL